MAILYLGDVFLEHDTGAHPECARRLKTVYAHLRKTGLIGRFEQGALRQATGDEVKRVHAADYLRTLAAFAAHGGGHIDGDTVVSPRSYDVALHAAGAAVDAVGQVLSGKHTAACCLTRPPGHHSLPSQAMGFCLLNNAAVAACHAIEAHGLSRVLIVDWDVHHGNGTQDIFYERADVCFFSAHRYPFYPGTGAEDETGSGAGLGATFNLPLRFGITRRQYVDRFTLKLGQAAAFSKPELVLISAGFDAHAQDPIGSLGLESEDFAELTRRVSDVAEQYAGGRIVSLLEGGYNVDALAESVAYHLEALIAPR